MDRTQIFWLIVILVMGAVAILSLLIYVFSLKHQMRHVKEELQRTRQTDNNQQMTVSLIDSDLNALTTEINQNLDYQKKLKLETEKKELQMRQSISDIAHDLRTPLTVVKGNLQLLKQEPLSTRARANLDICMDKTETLKTMVDDFFELSVLESETIPPVLTRMDLTSFVIQFLVDHEAIITGAGLTPRIELPEKSMFVQADAGMLERICSNLLNNIVKYAKKEFTVALTSIDQQIMLTFANELGEDDVVDTAHLFDRTYRADKARRESGAGLGLYIVKLLAEKQKLSVGAVQEHKLLRFEILFPEYRNS